MLFRSGGLGTVGQHLSATLRALPGRDLSDALDGSDDAVVCAAATQVVVQCGNDLGASGMRILLQQCTRADQDAAQAVPALTGIQLDERLLQGMGLALFAQSFQRGDLMALNGPQREIAGRLRSAVHQDHARAALAFAATQLGSGQTQFVSQPMQQRRFVREFAVECLSVDANHEGQA